MLESFLRFERSVVCIYIFLEKIYKTKKQLVQNLIPPPSIYIYMCKNSQEKWRIFRFHDEFPTARRWRLVGSSTWWAPHRCLWADAVSRIMWLRHIICSCLLGGFLHQAFLLMWQETHLLECGDASLGRIDASPTHAFFLALPHHCLPSYPFTLCTERSSTVRDSRRCPSPCRGRTELSTQPRRMFQDFWR